jgi:hypothetical protein
VDRQLVGKVAALGDLDRVDLADEVRDRDVGRRELLAVTAVATDPGYGHVVPVFLDEVQTSTTDRVVGVVVDLAPRDRRHHLVEKADQRAHDAALRLAALAEKDDVVSADDRVRQLRQYGLVVADDSRQQLLAGTQPREEVATHLLLHGLATVPACAELADGLGSGGGHPCTIEGGRHRFDRQTWLD